MVITIFLIHPTQAEPIRSWTFKQDSVVRVGRSKDNDVVIHGSLVSRHHLELWHRQGHWELINFGANGTFVEGRPVHQSPVNDGMVVRLGSTGPRLQLRLDFQQNEVAAGDRLTAHPVDS
ncbi:MAG: FHA domain-containing protein [Phormidium sp. GEM2.Bin31]|nr:MAG: FHA domain-containing protein [Phormidium sp. GEM2.Bin31]